jgi:effector-binding domain-containing protein
MEVVQMKYAFEVIDTELQPVLSERHVTSVDNLPLVIGKAYDEIFGYLAEMDESATDMPFVAYYNLDMENLEVEIGVPVARPIETKDNVHASYIPAGKKAVGMYMGPYQGMTEIYEAMNLWLAENHHEATGVVYEFYYNSPDEVPESELLTKVMFLLN